MCLQFGFGDDGELRVLAYALPKNGSKFTSEELKTNYLLASKESKAMKKDKKAAELFAQYTNAEKLSNDANGNPVPIMHWREKFYDGIETEDGETHDVADFNLGKAHRHDTAKSCYKCANLDFDREKNGSKVGDDIRVLDAFAGKKYKPVALKVRPVYAELPEKYHIKREIKGDPLENIPILPTNPTEFVPTGRYTQERKEIIDRVHGEGFLLDEEMKLLHNFMMLHNLGFA